MATPEDQDIFFISAEKATEACRNAVKTEERIAGFKSKFLVPLYDWCVGHKDRVAACYLPLPSGHIKAFIVTNSSRFNFSLGEEIAALKRRWLALVGGSGCSSFQKRRRTPWRPSLTQRGRLKSMPSADQHRIKAERNRRFLATIPLDDFPDWVVVAAFYTAVHLIERLRAAAGDGDSISHEDRLDYVQHRLPALHSAYHILQNAVHAGSLSVKCRLLRPIPAPGRSKGNH